MCLERGDILSPSDRGPLLGTRSSVWQNGRRKPDLAGAAIAHRFLPVPPHPPALQAIDASSACPRNHFLLKPCRSSPKRPTSACHWLLAFSAH